MEIAINKNIVATLKLQRWTHNTCAMEHHTQQNNTKLMPMMTIYKQEPPITPKCVEKQR